MAAPSLDTDSVNTGTVDPCSERIPAECNYPLYPQGKDQ